MQQTLLTIEPDRTETACWSGDVHRITYSLSSDAVAVISRSGVERNLRKQAQSRTGIGTKGIGVGLSIRRFVVGDVARNANGRAGWIPVCVSQHGRKLWNFDPGICSAARARCQRNGSRGIPGARLGVSSLVAGVVSTGKSD